MSNNPTKQTSNTLRMYMLVFVVVVFNIKKKNQYLKCTVSPPVITISDVFSSVAHAAINQVTILEEVTVHVIYGQRANLRDTLHWVQSARELQHTIMRNFHSSWHVNRPDPRPRAVTFAPKRLHVRHIGTVRVGGHRVHRHTLEVKLQPPLALLAGTAESCRAYLWGKWRERSCRLMMSKKNKKNTGVGGSSSSRCFQVGR